MPTTPAINQTQTISTDAIQHLLLQFLFKICTEIKQNLKRDKLPERSENPLTPIINAKFNINIYNEQTFIRSDWISEPYSSSDRYNLHQIYIGTSFYLSFITSIQFKRLGFTQHVRFLSHFHHFLRTTRFFRFVYYAVTKNLMEGNILKAGNLLSINHFGIWYQIQRSLSFHVEMGGKHRYIRFL